MSSFDAADYDVGMDYGHPEDVATWKSAPVRLAPTPGMPHRLRATTMRSTNRRTEAGVRSNRR